MLWLRSDQFESLTASSTLVLQFYSGKTAVLPNPLFLQKLIQGHGEFKVGLLPKELLPQDLDLALKQSPHFKGYVIFHGARKE